MDPVPWIWGFASLQSALVRRDVDSRISLFKRKTQREVAQPLKVFGEIAKCVLLRIELQTSQPTRFLFFQVCEFHLEPRESF